MTTPSSPNYKTDVGRLVLDRFDFQKHIDGTSFRHTADQVDLLSPLTINSQIVSSVESALSVLAAITSPPTVDDATTTTKGLIQLSGDISGTATNVSVTKIQGKPVSTLTPTTGDVLTWSGSSWAASVATNSFSASGDLGGTNITQEVIGLTGDSGSVRVSCDAVTFINTVVPSILQTDAVSNHGSSFSIKAQSGAGSNKNGGNLILSGGDCGSGGVRGGLFLQIGSGDTTMLQLSEIGVDRRIISLLNENPLTGIDMPAGTGDMVMYIRDTVTPPTSGNPSNGSILYSYGGKLYVKQEDGDNFSIGSIPNPSVWGDTGEQVSTSRVTATSSVGAAASAFTYTLPDESTVKIDVLFVAKGVNTADGASYNFSMGYLRDGGSPVAMDSATDADPRSTSGNAAAWVRPAISVVGNDLKIETGYSTLITVNWLVVVQLTIVQG